MLKTVVLLVLIGASAQSAQAQSKFTSVYTDMKKDCKIIREPTSAQHESGDPASECKGFGGYRIFISHSAQAAGLSVENLKNPNENVFLGSDYGAYGDRNEKIEWRLRDGKPFAVIARFGKYKTGANDENPFDFNNRTGSTIVVKGLRGFEHIDFAIDGATVKANEKARQTADRAFKK